MDSRPSERYGSFVSAMTKQPPGILSSGGDLTEPSAVRAAQDRFISFWGEMGTRWGVQRSMAEVHALLFIAGEPLSAEDIMERLAISRGSVSTTLKQLVEWGLVQRVKPKGRADRREFHQAEQDVWKLFYTILRARKRREFDPLIEQLDGCKVECKVASKTAAKSGAKAGRKSERERQHDQRIEELLALCVFFDGLANTISKSGKGIERATKILARVLGVAR
jgi:DNA-binding transcriptional regulator GbsR (MarR family)